MGSAMHESIQLTAKVARVTYDNLVLAAVFLTDGQAKGEVPIGLSVPSVVDYGGKPHRLFSAEEAAAALYPGAAAKALNYDDFETLGRVALGEHCTVYFKVGTRVLLGNLRFDVVDVPVLVTA